MERANDPPGHTACKQQSWALKATVQPQEGERRACCEDPLRRLPHPQPPAPSSLLHRHSGPWSPWPHASGSKNRCKFTDNFRLHLLCPSLPPNSRFVICPPTPRLHLDVHRNHKLSTFPTRSSCSLEALSIQLIPPLQLPGPLLTSHS